MAQSSERSPKLDPGLSPAMLWRRIEDENYVPTNDELAYAIHWLAEQVERPNDVERWGRDPRHVAGLLQLVRDRLTPARSPRLGRPPGPAPNPETVRLGARVLCWQVVLMTRYRITRGSKSSASKRSAHWEQLGDGERRRLGRKGITKDRRLSPREAALTVVNTESGISKGALRGYVDVAARVLDFDLAVFTSTFPTRTLVNHPIKAALSALGIRRSE